jgi:hypothetical protein
MVQKKYQEEKACDKRHPYRKIIIIIIIIIIRAFRFWFKETAAPVTGGLRSCSPPLEIRGVSQCL